MIQDLWINLPVKDLARSRTFFTELGFTFNNRFDNSSNFISLVVGEKKVVVMLFDETTFKGFINSAIADANAANEVLISIGLESKEQVDEMARKAVAAGGSSNHQPGDMQGWMYGCVFSDLDGHKWNVMYMDWSKMPQA